MTKTWSEKAGFGKTPVKYNRALATLKRISRRLWKISKAEW
jgi:hypothetical protein